MRTTLILAILAASAAVGSSKSQIAAPALRAAVISNVNKALQPKQFVHSGDLSKKTNPFAPIQPTNEPAPTPVSAKPLSDKDFAETLAAALNPTGVLSLGDNIFLLFGEKKIKAGDTMLIPYEKESYAVELTNLTRSSFTIKFNQVEVTRSIKPAKQP